MKSSSMDRQRLVLGLFALLSSVVAACASDPDGVGSPSNVAGNAGALGSVGGAGSPGSAGAANAAGTSGAQANGGAAGTVAGNAGTGGTSVGGTTNAGASSGGSAGSANGGNAGTSATTKSAGCGLPAGQMLNAWVEQPKLSVNNKDRQWWIWLPTDYDPARAYPVVFTFHGCGSPDNYVPMQKVTGKDAILIRGTGITGNCWTYGATGDDVKFFDAMLADVLAKRCVDAKRVFTTGYSSGSWLVNTLNCERGDKLRASGSVSGGVAVDTSKCVKSEFARLFIHDQADPTNDFVSAGNKAELARLVKANHCTDAAPVPEDPAPCARYQGCDAGLPVVMCPTMGKGHDRRDDLAPGAFWKFFSSL